MHSGLHQMLNFCVISVYQFDVLGCITIIVSVYLIMSHRVLYSARIGVSAQCLRRRIRVSLLQESNDRNGRRMRWHAVGVFLFNIQRIRGRVSVVMRPSWTSHATFSDYSTVCQLSQAISFISIFLIFSILFLFGFIWFTKAAFGQFLNMR